MTLETWLKIHTNFCNFSLAILRLLRICCLHLVCGLRYARLKVVVLQPTMVSRFGCFVCEFWVLRFRVLGASFSSFGCFVFEIWVLRASVFVFECFVFETTPKIKRSYPIKGRTPLIETQKFLRNKSTIVFQKCNLKSKSDTPGWLRIRTGISFNSGSNH